MTRPNYCPIDEENINNRDFRDIAAALAPRLICEAKRNRCSLATFMEQSRYQIKSGSIGIKKQRNRGKYQMPHCITFTADQPGFRLHFRCQTDLTSVISTS